MTDQLAGKIADEVEIVWIEGGDVVMERYDYVRQMLEKTPRKTGKPRRNMRAVRIIGYANLAADAEPTEPSGRYQRRMFYVQSNDRSEPDGQYQNATPHEAVDPRTVAPGVVGELTDRARGRQAAAASPGDTPHVDPQEPQGGMLF